MRLPLPDFNNESEWNIKHVSFGINLTSITKDPYTKTESFQVRFPKGSYKPSASIKGGVIFYASPSCLPRNKAILSYKVFFPQDFDWVKGGKLPGLVIGENGATGGHRYESGGTCRVMWRSHGNCEAYIYLPLDCCWNQDANVRRNGQFGDSVFCRQLHFKKGIWNEVEMQVILNDPGKSNGKLELKVNGDECVLNSVEWRKKKELKISSIVVGTFFGGGTAEWATPHDTCIYFKDFSIM